MWTSCGHECYYPAVFVVMVEVWSTNISSKVGMPTPTHFIQAATSKSGFSYLYHFHIRCTNSMQQSCNRPTDLFINGSSLCICACGSYFHCQTAEPIRLKFGMWSPSNWMSINYEPPVSVVMGVVYHRHTHCGKLYHSSIMILPLKDDA